MFRNELQESLVCHTLLTLNQMRDLWTPNGPTQRACALLKAKGGGMSHGERLMLRAAFDVWNGHGHLDLGEALATLDGKNLRALGMLLVALGDARGAVAIDEWLSAYHGSSRRGGETT